MVGKSEKKRWRCRDEQKAVASPSQSPARQAIVEKLPKIRKKAMDLMLLVRQAPADPPPPMEAQRKIRRDVGAEERRCGT
jgi:hypothetical protein